MNKMKIYAYAYACAYAYAYAYVYLTANMEPSMRLRGAYYTLHSGH